MDQVPNSSNQEECANRLVEVVLDEESISRSNPDTEHERAVAIYDLLEENKFQVVGHDAGPYRLNIAMVENRLVFAISNDKWEHIISHVLSLTPFRKIIKDYFLICESYHEAIKTATPSQIEAIDMGRRGVHNDGSELLAERLDGKIAMDHLTARRIFTLICALHWKG